MAENVKKYHHNEESCPLLDDPRLYSYIGDFIEGPQIEAILDDKYVCPEDKYPLVKKILRHLQRPSTVSGKEPPTLMILAEYREYWKIVKEIILHRDLTLECINQRHRNLYHDISSTKILEFHTY